MAAFNDELTAQIVVLTDQVQTLSNRLNIAEQNQTLQHAGSKGGEQGVFDKKRLLSKGTEGGMFLPLLVRAVHRVDRDG